jgi:hypothetical protein
MYPQLFNQAARIAPKLSRILSRGGSFASPFWKASQIDVPDVTATPVPPVVKPTGPQVPISGPQDIKPPPSPLTQPTLGGMGLFPPANITPMNWLQGGAVE